MILHQHMPEVKRLLKTGSSEYDKLCLIRYHFMHERKEHTRPPIDVVKKYAGDNIDLLFNRSKDYFSKVLDDKMINKHLNAKR